MVDARNAIALILDNYTLAEMRALKEPLQLADMYDIEQIKAHRGFQRRFFAAKTAARDARAASRHRLVGGEDRATALKLATVEFATAGGAQLTFRGRHEGNLSRGCPGRRGIPRTKMRRDFI